MEKRLKNYKDSLPLQILNILIEWLLIVAAYYISAAIRRLTPVFLAKAFSFSADAVRFGVISYISAAFSVFVYFILGDYRTIHYRKLSTESSRVLIVQFVSGHFISALLYWFKGGQFSRVWLVQYIAVSFFMIICKRIAFHYLSDRFFGKYLSHNKLLVIGSGRLSARYMDGIKNVKGNRVEAAGYLAAHANPDISGYLGDITKLPGLLDDLDIGEVVIAEGELSSEELKTVLMECHVHNASAYIIARFNDFLLGGLRAEYREDVPGLCLFPVDIMRTSDVLGVNIAVTNMDQTIDNIRDNLDGWRGEYICVSNVHTTVMAHDDEEYRRIQNNAVLTLPDGGPLSSYSRKRGNNTAMRVTGPDLMHELLNRTTDGSCGHFFYGSSEKTLNTLRARIEEAYPGARISGMISPPFRELSAEEDEEYIKQINDAGPDIVWVGLGAPKQEIWMAGHRGKINALMIGVGAAFDYESGNIKRAPQWMQRANLEWLYRLLQDPGRLLKRYLSTNFKFLWLTRK